MSNPSDDKSVALSEKKRQLLAMLARDRAAASARTAPPVEPAERDVAMSFGQQRLWFLERWMPETTLYNEYLQLRLTGTLDVAALERALADVVGRHEALRTVFREENGEPRAVARSSVEVAIDRRDVSGPDANAREAALLEIEGSELARPFDLERGPLLRATLVRLTPEESALLVSVHHLVCDGWSLGIFLREVVTLYRAHVQSRGGSARAALPALPMQYATYAESQRAGVDSLSNVRQLAYWRDKLTGAAPVLQLPTTHKRPAVRTTQGATEFFHLDAALVDRLQSLGRAHQSTLYMVLLAAFSSLLNRYTGQQDIVVGSPVAGRTAAEHEGLIGFFVNTLAMRTDLSGDPSFVELLARVRATALGAYANQDVPFEQLVDELKPPRDLGYSPIFQVMMVLQPTPIGTIELPGLRIEQRERDRGTAKFDVSLSFAQGPAGLSGALEYNTDLFDAPSMRRMVGHLTRLLASACDAPHMPVSTLPILSDAERHHLLLERNPTRAFHNHTPLHTMFERQVRARPDSVAVNDGAEHLTYDALNRRANQLARHLRARGVGPDVVVGMCLERSLDLLVAILGILKAGGAYLPLDPVYPADRRAFMVEDSGTKLVVSHRALAGSFAASGVEIVALDGDGAAIGAESDGDLDLPFSADQLAYVIYTSGSTGRPKGCLLTHRNVLRLFTGIEHWFGFSERDVWPLFHSCAFDLSVWEMWGAWLYGGRLTVVPLLVSRSPDAFYDLLLRERVTVLTQTPSAFRPLIREDERRDADRANLRLAWIVFAGEALELGSLRPWFDNHADTSPRIVNMYGITETTVHVTYREIRASDVESGKGSVIGVPIPDLQCYVLDQHRQPVPLGVAGELYVGGEGVARGYLARPELTAERFMPDPFSGIPGSTMYKSGDIVRALPVADDGAFDMEYIGRSDFQVKIRGFRVELEEIEAAIGRQPGVRECIVLVRDEGGEKRLVAYVVGATHAALTARALHDALSASLPVYMVPSAFVVMESFPLTTNGKLDRRALPAPTEASSMSATREKVAATTDLERSLLEVWRTILGARDVGATDNFFDAGGSSLTMATVQARLRDRHGVSVSMIDLFKYPTVRELAAHLSAVAASEAAGSDAAMVPTSAADAGATNTRRVVRRIRREGGDE